MKNLANRIQEVAHAVSPETDHALRRKEHDQPGTASAPHAEFNDLVAKWTHDPEFDKVMASHRRIDTAKWK
ncbi:MAG: hypothetical protein J0L64_16655 [Acidobacteria bacterium]|nr:hypothetical protein [Acidobacteriota bacterium]